MHHTSFFAGYTEFGEIAVMTKEIHEYEIEGSERKQVNENINVITSTLYKVIYRTDITNEPEEPEDYKKIQRLIARFTWTEVPLPIYNYIRYGLDQEQKCKGWD